jgi:hypothetical protein
VQECRTIGGDHVHVAVQVNVVDHDQVDVNGDAACNRDRP